ncbi:hypothetical protein [Polynucleobacter sp. AP-Nickl1-40-C4]|jgi:uncharacterized protein (DUF4415 family)|uniref:hypothetical protein n=1 Tax=Polynucleobacter sp. AP-Nickl1-40-C4 TaxID=3108275 RepID=UPI002B22CE26|nr:hypothetical protein [Polynucleobacter sp. AP-Nickl1-40-C4]MEA9567361.1 hypothetical protein [Polynucleobacter sp. AP-Nickl1-40-C4]
MNSKQLAKEMTNTPDAWEGGELGQSPEHVRVAPSKLASEIDDALGLQMISIRLDKELIDMFKLLGGKYQMGYQPLMREALKRFVDGELKMVALEALEKQSLARSKSKDEKNHPKKEKVAKAA